MVLTFHIFIILTTTSTLAADVMISKCVGSDLVIRPADYTNGQELYYVECNYNSEPKRFVATWLNSTTIYAASERFEFVDTTHPNNLTLLIKNIKTSDAGQYLIETILAHSYFLLFNYLTVQTEEITKLTTLNNTLTETFNNSDEANTTNYPVVMSVTKQTNANTVNYPVVISVPICILVVIAIIVLMCVKRKGYILKLNSRGEINNDFNGSVPML